MACNSFTSVSLEPPLVLICIDQRLQTHEALRAAKGWIVNVLREDQESLSRRFATASEDKFEGLRTEVGPYGARLIGGAVAHLAARRRCEIEAGDHRIFIGEVTSLDYEEGQPLIFFGGRYGLKHSEIAQPIS
jgi:flavin reductase (DIM6/NTAB) family NADH-FMN oxidoreductase RutF